MQIDESLFCHKPKVSSIITNILTHKYDSITMIYSVVSPWPQYSKGAVGIIGFMVLVVSRDAATLLPLIQQHVSPGSIV